MKKIAIIVSTLAFCLAMVSCGEKCTTCTYTYDVGGAPESTTLPQFCGTKSLVDAHKESIQGIAETEAALLGGTNIQTSCVDD